MANCVSYLICFLHNPILARVKTIWIKYKWTLYYCYGIAFGFLHYFAFKFSWRHPIWWMKLILGNTSGVLPIAFINGVFKLITSLFHFHGLMNWWFGLLWLFYNGIGPTSLCNFHGMVCWFNTRTTNQRVGVMQQS